MTDSLSSSLNAKRALDILLILGEAGAEGISLSQIADKVSCAKSAAHRSLASLMQKGFAEQTGSHGRYRLGPAIPILARQNEQLEPQIQAIRPGMSEFARLTGFPVYLMVQAGVDAICAEIISRSTERHFKLGVGARVPMGIAAGSMALLSALTPKEAEQIIKANAKRYSQHPSLRPINADIITAQIVDARARGYAINLGYYLPGEGGLGLPLPPRGISRVNMAVSFNVPLEMMSDHWIEQIMDKLRKCLS